MALHVAARPSFEKQMVRIRDSRQGPLNEDGGMVLGWAVQGPRSPGFTREMLGICEERSVGLGIWANKGRVSE